MNHAISCGVVLTEHHRVMIGWAFVRVVVSEQCISVISFRRTKIPDTEKIREGLRELKQYRKLDDACEAANIFGDTLEKVLDECEPRLDEYPDNDGACT